MRNMRERTHWLGDIRIQRQEFGHCSQESRYPMSCEVYSRVYHRSYTSHSIGCTIHVPSALTNSGPCFATEALGKLASANTARERTLANSREVQQVSSCCEYRSRLHGPFWPAQTTAEETVSAGCPSESPFLATDHAYKSFSACAYNVSFHYSPTHRGSS